MLPESTMIYPGNHAQMDALNMSASAFPNLPPHFLSNPTLHELQFADSFSQPASPSASSLFDLYTNADAVPTSNSTLADERENMTSTPKAAVTTATTKAHSSADVDTTTQSAPNPTLTSAPAPVSAPAPAPASAKAPAPAPTPISTSTDPAIVAAAITSASSVSTSMIPQVPAPISTTASTTPASFNNSPSNVFSPTHNQFFTTAPTPAFNSRSSSSGCPAKPTFSSAAKPQYTPRTVNPIDTTTKTGQFRMSKAKARHKQRMKMYKPRRDNKKLETPCLVLPNEAPPPVPPTSIHMYSDARLSVAKVCWLRLTPMLRITKLYFDIYSQSETSSWSDKNKTETEVAEQKQRFKDEYLVHVHSFMAQVEAMKAFIELGRKDIGPDRTGFLLRGVSAMLIFMKEVVGQRPQVAGPRPKESSQRVKGSETPVDEDMCTLHRMFVQFGQILNKKLEIKWKFSNEKLVSGGGVDIEENSAWGK